MASRQTAAQVPSRPSTPVEIVSPSPLPVTGTLGLTAGSSVTVSNPISSPIPVLDVGRGSPFQKTGISINGILGQVDFGSPQAGQRWIIHHVSAEVSANPGTSLTVTSFTMFIGPFGPGLGDTVIPQRTADNVTVANSQTEFVVNAGEELILSFHGEFTVGSSPIMRAFISGVVVPVT